ncbi:IPT/TIG domain-containing protein [Nafulsella turpanensis]|uniref:IPT/TIG domain-containing protein n=1 Tax=Nafulsella turpanensis TaxID=1265690 RepID=UPI0003497EE3|nr:IPT/TIG domain-containing protein [Nafulsella turpanensis]
MKNKLYIALIILLLGCEKEVEFEYPLVQTGEVTDITKRGGNFNAKLLATAEDEIIEHGFIWGDRKGFSHEKAQILAIEGVPESGTFSAFFPTVLSQPTEIYIRAFVRTRHHVSYGSEVSFLGLKSEAPELIDFFPKEGYSMDTLVLTGRYFSTTTEHNKVYFDSVASSIIYSSTDTLKVIVPKLLKDSAKVSVSLLKEAAAYSRKFTFLAPRISGFYPEKGNLRDSLVIVGQNFSADYMENNYNYTEVKLGGVAAEILHLSPDTVIVKVPTYSYSTEALSVEIRNQNYLRHTAEKEFNLNAPLISGFYPHQVNINDTLVIYGTNLAMPSGQSWVTIGNHYNLQPLHASGDTIKVLIPDLMREETAEIKIKNHNLITVTAGEKITLITPELSGFTPEEISLWESTPIIIKGTNFTKNPASLKVFIGEHEATIQEITPSQLKVLTPAGFAVRESQVYVQMNNFKKQAPGILLIAPLRLDDFYPKVISTGQELTITGADFHPVRWRNKVIIGGAEARVLQVSVNELKVEVPTQPAPHYPPAEVSVSVEVMGDLKTFEEKLLIDIPWSQISEFPGVTNSYSLNQQFIDYESFVIGNKVYIGLCFSNEWWSFEPSSLQWHKLADFPGKPRIKGTGFVLNGKVYFGGGYNHGHLQDWWLYDPSTDSWSKKNDLPLTATSGFSILGFMYNMQGYLVVSNPESSQNNIIVYNEEQDLWNHYTAFPESFSTKYHSSYFAHVVGNELFLGFQRTMFYRDIKTYSYSFTDDIHWQWRELSSYPNSTFSYQPLIFSYNNYFLYLKTDAATNFHSYQRAYRSWVPSPVEVPENIRGGISFQINGKDYIGLGGSRAIWVYEPKK